LTFPSSLPLLTKAETIDSASSNAPACVDQRPTFAACRRNLASLCPSRGLRRGSCPGGAFRPGKLAAGTFSDRVAGRPACRGKGHLRAETRGSSGSAFGCRGDRRDRPPGDTGRRALRSATATSRNDVLVDTEEVVGVVLRLHRS
jgi:hypothetical protein